MPSLVLAPFTASSQNLKKTEEEFEHYKSQWRGKLRGKIVLYSKPVVSHVGERAMLTRYTDAQLADHAKSPDPEKKPVFKGGDDVPEDPQEARDYNASLSPSQRGRAEFAADRCCDEAPGVLPRRRRRRHAGGGRALA